MEFKEAIEQFKSWREFKVKINTVRGYDRELRNFCLYLHNPQIEQIQLTDVLNYLNGMRDLGWDHNSFVGKVMAIRKFLEFFKLQGYRVLNEELIPIPNKEYKMPRVADDETFKKLFDSIPVNNDPRHIRNRAIISLLWDTGARNGEILDLDIDDLDLDRQRAVIKTEKNKGRRPIREIFWTKDTNIHVKNWLGKREHLAKKIYIKEPEALFISVANQQQGQRLSVKGVGESLRRYSNRAKIPYLNAHSFRHHMGHDVIKKGGSAADVMNILGHSTLASSTIYTMMTDRELEKRYRVFKGA
ncbi:MAG: tyrosine-type recombinase/integrase [Candidatus Komeilibacteria bacterium]|nr:tyrosine-type recombinase/integrase [Candidatus Komeilibacteria bacterium]